jgi:hypothetical protein
MVVKWSVLGGGRPFTPKKIPGTHFYQKLGLLLGHSAAYGIKSKEKSINLIGNRIRDIETCSIVPQPITLVHLRIITLHKEESRFR